MRGMISLDDVIAGLPKDQREKVEVMRAELGAKIRERMTLADVRKQRKLSQAAIAEALGVGQAQISRLEQRKDPRISTLKRTVEAMGGSLTMIVTFPDQEPMLLTPAATPDKKKKARARGSAKARKPSRKMGEARSGAREAQA